MQKVATETVVFFVIKRIPLAFFCVFSLFHLYLLRRRLFAARQQLALPQRMRNIKYTHHYSAIHLSMRGMRNVLVSNVMQCKLVNLNGRRQGGFRFKSG